MQWVLIAYDITTDDKAGRKRLRRVAKVCERYGRRVQKSLFECQGNDKTLQKLRFELLDEIDEKYDSLRIYHMGKEIENKMESFGVDETFRFDDPLVF